MKISELFYSIQGEGKRTGVPSFFIRTNFCNLRCKFSSGNLCDTPYTSWTPDDSLNIGDMSIEEIINEYLIYSCKDVVITGGEPTMQGDELTALCTQLKNKNSYITLETNGTYIGDFINNIDLVSISPKLSNSIPTDTKYENMHNENRINVEVLKSYHENFRKGLFDIQWKFVVNSEKDISEILSLKEKIGFDSEHIYLMPEGVTKSDIQNKREKIVELCKEHKFNFSDRLHILIWGDKRGV